MEAITRAARLGRTLGESPRQEDKMHLDIFATLAVPLTSLSNSGLQRCRFFRILPPYGVPRAGRAAEDGDGLLGRLRGDARLHRQLRLHLSRLDRQLPPLSPLLLHTWTKSLPSGHRFFLGSTLLHRNNPRYRPPLKSLLFKATVHSLYNHRNVILTAHVFHRISNCSYMLSIVFCSGRILLATECEDF